jgi:hypothetical protein
MASERCTTHKSRLDLISDRGGGRRKKKRQSLRILGTHYLFFIDIPIAMALLLYEKLDEVGLGKEETDV